jgi:LmbE family N-acetylglucosaminyl deacetylase
MLPVTSMLVVAAHPDDEVLGCGGYIAARVRSGDEVTVMFIADGVTSRDGNLGAFEIETRRQAANSAAKVLGVKDVLFGDFPDNKLDSVPILEVIKFIEEIVSRTKPSVVLTHFGGDLNVDHRVVNQAVITACRPTSDQCVKQVLFFEIPSSTEWQIPSKEEAFMPNWFEDISESLDAKIKALEQYALELRDWPHPRSVEGVKHLAHWRGASCGVNAAEAFILGRRTP